MLRNHEARCMANPGHNQRWMYRYTITAGVNILLDIPCSERCMILWWETVQYAGKIKRQWLRRRKIDRRCLQRRSDYGASGNPMQRLWQHRNAWQYSRLLSKKNGGVAGMCRDSGHDRR